jgi:hypothetical protein
MIMKTGQKVEQLTELDNAVLLLLKFAEKKGIPYLTQAQVQKAIYMLQVKSREYVGEDFSTAKFVRQARGPISINVKDSLQKLASPEYGYISTEDVEVNSVRHSFQHKLQRDFENVVSPSKALFALSTFQILEKKYPKFRNGRQEIRLGSYDTDPMLEIQEKERKQGEQLNGEPIDFDLVRLNSNIVDIIGSE